MTPHHPDLCPITVLKKTWKILQDSKNLEEAKKRFQASIIELILDEEARVL